MVKPLYTRAIQFDTLTRQELRPFYKTAVKRDTDSLEQARKGMQAPQPIPWRERLAQSFVQHGLAPAMRGHLDVRRAFVRDFNMLDRPGAAIQRPAILFHILRFWIRGKKRNAHLYAPSPGPNRSDMRLRLGLPVSQAS